MTCGDCKNPIKGRGYEFRDVIRCKKCNTKLARKLMGYVAKTRKETQ